MARRERVIPVSGAISTDTAVVAAPSNGQRIVVKYVKLERTDASNTTTVGVVGGAVTFDSHIFYAQGDSVVFYAEDGYELELAPNTALTIETDFGIVYTAHYWLEG